MRAPLFTFAEGNLQLVFMKGIDVGNIALHKNSKAVCVICRVDKKGNSTIIYGTDCNNHTFKGDIKEWKNILAHKSELHNFEDSIINNIVASRGF